MLLHLECTELAQQSRHVRAVEPTFVIDFAMFTTVPTTVATKHSSLGCLLVVLQHYMARSRAFPDWDQRHVDDLALFKHTLRLLTPTQRLLGVQIHWSM